jgi:hypothetical protein
MQGVLWQAPALDDVFRPTPQDSEQWDVGMTCNRRGTDEH